MLDTSFRLTVKCRFVLTNHRNFLPVDWNQNAFLVASLVENSQIGRRTNTMPDSAAALNCRLFYAIDFADSHLNAVCRRYIFYIETSSLGYDYSVSWKGAQTHHSHRIVKERRLSRVRCEEERCND